jgi:hypothetical protein
MDPLSALSLAASILTFVDYARQIITGTSEIYHSASGITKDNAYIEDVIKDLKQVTTDLDGDIVGQTKHEKALISLGEKCHKLSEELLGLIGSLAYDGERTAWKSFKTKIKSMRKEKEVTSMEKRLGEYRSEILPRLTFTL